MFDWVGSLRIRRRTAQQVELGLARGTEVVGWVGAAIGLGMAIRAWAVAPYLAILPGVLCLCGLLLASLKRRLVFDRADGVLRMEQSVLGLTSRTVVPLFHLRAVVVASYGRRPAPGRRGALARHVAFLARRSGQPIFLDEARRCARLLHLAEQIAEVSELRLEYDATAQARVSRQR